ncbi:MAG: hypothetical protein AAB804_02515 [Patescibacteria group bacterium]
MDFHAWWALAEQWPTDWIIIGALVTFVALDALRSGSARAAALALSLPAALVVTNALPQAFFLGPLTAEFTAPMIHVAIFSGIFVLLYFATHRSIFTFSVGGGIIQSIVAGIAAIIVLILIWLQIPTLDSVWNFGGQVRAVFAPAYQFWWFFVAFLGLTFARS